LSVYGDSHQGQECPEAGKRSTPNIPSTLRKPVWGALALLTMLDSQIKNFANTRK